MAELIRSAYVEASLSIVKLWMAKEYARYSGKLLPVVIAKSSDDFRQMNRIEPRDGSDVAPIETFAMMSMGSIGLDSDLGIAKRLAGNGVQVGSDRDKGISYHSSLRPVILGYGLAFITTDINNVYMFAETMLNNAPTLAFDIVNEQGFNVKITLMIEPELTLPPPDADVGGLYRFETECKIRTYIGVDSTQRLIRRIKVSTIQSDSPHKTNVIFDDAVNKLDEDQFTYQDLFDKQSKYYKYDGGD